MHTKLDFYTFIAKRRHTSTKNKVFIFLLLISIDLSLINSLPQKMHNSSTYYTETWHDLWPPSKTARYSWALQTLFSFNPKDMVLVLIIGNLICHVWYRLHWQSWGIKYVRYCVSWDTCAHWVINSHCASTHTTYTRTHTAYKISWLSCQWHITNNTELTASIVICFRHLNIKQKGSPWNDIINNLISICNYGNNICSKTNRWQTSNRFLQIR